MCSKNCCAVSVLVVAAFFFFGQYWQGLLKVEEGFDKSKHFEFKYCSGTFATALTAWVRYLKLQLLLSF